MDVLIKEIKKQTYIVPELLNFIEVKEQLDVKLDKKRITWTDQYNIERDITKLADNHAANLAAWLREEGLYKTEKIIKAELERRCTNKYPEGFDELINNYKSSPEIWRLKVY